MVLVGRVAPQVRSKTLRGLSASSWSLHETETTGLGPFICVGRNAATRGLVTSFVGCGRGGSQFN